MDASVSRKLVLPSLRSSGLHLARCNDVLSGDRGCWSVREVYHSGSRIGVVSIACSSGGENLDRILDSDRNARRKTQRGRLQSDFDHWLQLGWSCIGGKDCEGTARRRITSTLGFVDRTDDVLGFQDGAPERYSVANSRASYQYK